MAQLLNKNPSDILNYTEYANTFSRLTPTPLERYEIFYDLKEARKYASSNPIAYVGQRLVVIDEQNDITLYYIDKIGELNKIITRQNLSEQLSRDLDTDIYNLLRYHGTIPVTDAGFDIDVEDNVKKEELRGLVITYDGYDYYNDGSSWKIINDAKERIEALHSRIDLLSNVMNFRGVTDKIETVTNPNNGDVVICGEKEYVYYDGAWKEFGDTTAHAAEISALTTKVETVQTATTETLPAEIANALAQAKTYADQKQPIWIDDYLAEE